MLRYSELASNVFQKFLMLIGVFFLLALVGVQSGNPTMLGSLKSLLPASDDIVFVEGEADGEEADVASEALNARMRGAMDYVSKRYRVAPDALEPIFVTAQSTGRQLHLDPLLIIAVIGIESRFNPFSESVVGAKGLMQVMPRFHQDKLPEDVNQAAFLNPVINVQVGAKVLQESIRRRGSLVAGLQQYAGSSDNEGAYANKVLAEKRRLEQLVFRAVPSRMAAPVKQIL
jgi:hypothetical protein